MDALKVFDKKLREPAGQKYMGARSTEDLTADVDPTKQPSKSELAEDANGMPMLPPKTKDAEKNVILADMQKQVSTVGGGLFLSYVGWVRNIQLIRYDY